MANIKKRSKTHGESWKFQRMRQCLVRKEQRNTSRFRKLQRRDVNPTRFQKQSMHASWRRMSPRDNSLESSPLKDHEDHFAGKGNNSMTHFNLVHKFIPMPQMMKILFAKAAVDKEWKQRETIPAWQLDKVKSKKRGCSRSTKRQKESPLCHNEGHLSSQKCGVRTQISEVQRKSRTPR